MTPVLSTTAWVMHDLGLATSFGGSLFGKVGLHPAVRHATSESDRGVIVADAWKGFSIFNAVSLAVSAGTWIVGRTMLTGREVSRSARVLVYVKDALMATAVLSGFGSMATGYAFSEARTAPAETTAKAPGALKDASNVLGYVHLAAVAGIIGVTALLAMQSGNSAKWSVRSRLLP